MSLHSSPLKGGEGNLGGREKEGKSPTVYDAHRVNIVQNRRGNQSSGGGGKRTEPYGGRGEKKGPRGKEKNKSDSYHP